MLGSGFKEKKLNWSIVFAWLYLHTFGKILPKKWNKWAENILDHYEVTNSNEVTKPGGDKDVSFSSELQKVTNSDRATQTEDNNNHYVSLSSESLDSDYGTAPSYNGSEIFSYNGSEIFSYNGSEIFSHDGSESEGLSYDNEFACKFSLLPEPEDEELFAQMEVFQANLAKSNEKYLRETIEELENRIKQLEREFEASQKDASKAIQILKKENKTLRTENRKFQQVSNKQEEIIKSLEDGEKKEYTLQITEKPNTSMTGIINDNLSPYGLAH